MVENQKVSSNRQTPRRALTREERMRRLQRRRAKRRKVIGIAVFTLTAIAVLIAMILIIKNGIGTDKLHGVWRLDDTTSYEFDGKENGAMLISDSKYRFTYEIKKDKLFIDYESDILVDGEYTFKVKRDVLTLTGENGTSGDTYELNKKE